MLSKLIADSYQTLIEIMLWLTLVVALYYGWDANKILGLMFGFAIWVFVMALLTGFFLVIVDIRNRVVSIDQQLKARVKEKSEPRMHSP